MSERLEKSTKCSKFTHNYVEVSVQDHDVVLIIKAGKE